MNFKHVIFYYTSGTGNSYQLCLWAQEYYSQKGINSSLIPIEKANPREEIVTPEELLVFFVMPTHGFTAPWNMLKFCLFFPKQKKLRFVSLASKASFLFGNFLLPGINGSGNYWISSLLTLKGLLPEAMTSINMPSNWTTFHPAQNDKHVTEIFKRARRSLDSFLPSIEKGRGRFFTWTNICEFIWGGILFPITFFYFLYGKIFLAKTYYADQKCDRCGLCIELCPSQSIVKNPKGLFWKYTCDNCMRCHNICPQKAIQGSYSWGILLFLIVSLSALTGWLVLVLYYALVIGGYHFLFWLSTKKWGGRLLNATTPTPWYRRYKLTHFDFKKLNSKH